MHIALLGLTLVAAAPPRPGSPTFGYLYELSDIAGPIHESPGDIWYDRQSSEIFVVGYGVVRVFNQTGMETFTFRVDPALGAPMSVVPVDSGDLLVLTRGDAKTSLWRCNFRGELCERVRLQGLPADWSEFGASALRRAGDVVYAVDMNGMRVVTMDTQGQVRGTYDLASEIGSADQRSDLGLSGFDVARDGTMLFTIAPLFRAYALPPGGKLRPWGTPGGAPGRFNVVKGVVADDRGRFYVLDALKSAVIAFDEDLRFLGEFGYRGNRPGNLNWPTAIAFGDGRLFVAQNGHRGIAVFRIHEN